METKMEIFHQDGNRNGNFPMFPSRRKLKWRFSIKMEIDPFFSFFSFRSFIIHHSSLWSWSCWLVQLVESFIWHLTFDMFVMLHVHEIHIYRVSIRQILSRWQQHIIIFLLSSWVHIHHNALCICSNYIIHVLRVTLISQRYEMTAIKRIIQQINRSNPSNHWPLCLHKSS